jgi:hypothetical protein
MRHVSAIVLLTLSVSGVARADDDGNDCTLRTLHGRYVFTASGHNIVSVAGVVLWFPQILI